MLSGSLASCVSLSLCVVPSKLYLAPDSGVWMLELCPKGFGYSLFSTHHESARLLIQVYLQAINLINYRKPCHNSDGPCLTLACHVELILNCLSLSLNIEQYTCTSNSVACVGNTLVRKLKPSYIKSHDKSEIRCDQQMVRLFGYLLLDMWKSALFCSCTMRT